MYHTLRTLQKRIDQLVESYGEDAPVAAFVFSPADVFTLDEDCNEEYLPYNDASEILHEVGTTDYIYEVIGECIDDEIRRFKKATNINS